jgi:hypothetical protein
MRWGVYKTENQKLWMVAWWIFRLTATTTKLHGDHLELGLQIGHMKIKLGFSYMEGV